MNQLSKNKFLLVFIISIFFITIIHFTSNAQNSTLIPNSASTPFYQTSDFWEKVILTVLGASLGGLFGYFSAAKKRNDESVEISYTTYSTSVLEFKKDLNKEISILYDKTIEAKNLYLLSCDLENTGKKVIHNEDIVIEISPVGNGILDSFFEPPLGNNTMGVEEVNNNIQQLDEDKAKKQYKIRKFEPGDKLGIRFITSINNHNHNIPNLFPRKENENSKFELNTKAYSRDNIDNKIKLMSFIKLFLMFFFVPPLFSIIPVAWFSGIGVNLARFIILLLIFPYINLFSKTIVDLLIRLAYKDSNIECRSDRSITINAGNYNEKIEGDYVQSLNPEELIENTEA